MSLNKITEKVKIGVPDWHGTSITDFDTWVEQQSQTSRVTIFRGQRKYWPLLPRVINDNKRGVLLENEKKLLNLFKKEASRCLHVVPISDWDWLVVAQHHGLPTRLLDWSYDPYIALWFALKKHNYGDSAPEVWILNVQHKDIISSYENTRPFQGVRTKIFNPSFKIPRVRAQKGCFTLFKHIEKVRNGFVALEKNRVIKLGLQRFRVASFACQEMKSWLENNGYTEDIIYPNIEEVAKLVRQTVLGEV